MAVEWHVGNAGLGTYFHISAQVPFQVPVKFGEKPWRLATLLPVPQWLWVWHLLGTQEIFVKWINKWIESKGLVYRWENQGSEESRVWSRSCVKCVGHSGPWVPVHWSPVEISLWFHLATGTTVATKRMLQCFWKFSWMLLWYRLAKSWLLSGKGQCCLC